MLFFAIITIAAIAYVVYKVVGEMKESREPLYPKFQKTHFQPNRNSITEYCPVCRQSSITRYEWNRTTTLCDDCAKLLNDRSVLRELKAPGIIAKTCQKDQIVALNLIQIDLQRGNYSVEEANGFRKEVIREIVESRSKYRPIKEKLRNSTRGRAESWMFEETSGNSATCRVCGRSRYGECKCLNDFHVDYGQGKIPSRLRALSEEARRLNKPEMGFWFEDWLYLKLIADDFGQGIISKSEAEHERNSYIEVVYNDAKQRIEEFLCYK